jgi:hypothetical protein
VIVKITASGTIRFNPAGLRVLAEERQAARDRRDNPPAFRLIGR